MKTYFDCIPCFVRQTLDSVRLITDDEQIHEQVMREALCLACKMDLRQSPPAMAQKIHRLIRKLTGVQDPYLEIKNRFNKLVLKMYPELRKQVEVSEDPLETAIRLAIAGNIIDLGVKTGLAESQVEETIVQSLTEPLDMDALNEFRAATDQAKDILYLGDNAGEIAFDRLLIEQLPCEKITFVVKAAPIINDATMEDAQIVGLTDIVTVIDNGSDAPGTILGDCSEAFRRRFNKADLVIAKGQGNYETLSDVNKDIFFILKSKCPVIARHLGCEIGEMILRKSKIVNSPVDLIKEEQTDAGI
jgi:uncharacterized protein with ATP-grasp and redox domains